MKCLPASKISECNGVGLHDWHAEILTIRTFNRYILDECSKILDGEDSDLVEYTSTDHAQPFRMRLGVKLHMYASEAPCTFLRHFKPRMTPNMYKAGTRVWKT